MMKKLLLFIGLLTLVATGAPGAETRPFAEPILLTSCGQSADALMMKALMTKDSLNFVYLPTATADDLKGKGSLVMVVGGSSKGLGAAKISAEDETARATALLEAAHKANIPVLVAHLGGMARRGVLSDGFNRLGAEGAQHIIVVKGGNDDGLFAKIAEEKKIPLETADTALDVAPMLSALYRTE
jgi:hypothetical protein